MMEFSKLFIVIFVLIAKTLANEEPDYEAKLNALQWQFLDNSLTKLYHLIIHQDSEHVRLAELSDETSLPTIDQLEIINKYILNPPTPQPEIHVDRLSGIVNENMDIPPFNIENYNIGRKNLRQALRLAFQVIKKPDSTLKGEDVPKKEKLHEKCKAAEFNTIRNSLKFVLKNKADLQSVLAPSYNRKQFLSWSKSIISDYVGLMVLDHGACLNLHDFPKFTEEQGQEIVNALIDAEHRILDNWNGTQLDTDVREWAKDLNTDKDIDINDDIKKELDEKYYWNSFRVHTYKGGLANSASLLVSPGDNAKVITIPNKPYSVIVRWSESVIASIKIDKTLDGVPLPPELAGKNGKGVFEPRATTKKPSKGELLSQTELKGIAKYNGWAQKAGDMLKTVSKKKTTILGVLTKVAKEGGKLVKTFKSLLKVVGAISAFIGPVGAIVSGILSIFLESGPGVSEVLNEMKKSFKDVHHRFDVLEGQLVKHKNEILEAIENKTEFHTSFAVYKSHVVIPLDAFMQERNKTSKLGKRDFVEPHQRKNMKDLCFPTSSKFGPYSLLTTLKTFYNNGPNDIGSAIKAWAKHTDPNKVKRLLMWLAMDAMNTGYLIASGCIFKDHTLPYAARLSMSAEAAKDVQNIMRKLGDIYDHFIYGWQGDVPKLVTDMVLAKDDTTRSVDARKERVITEIGKELNQKFPGRNFHVFTATGQGWNGWDGLKGNYKFQWVADPDYAVMIHVEPWRLFVNWNDQSETESYPKLNCQYVGSGQCSINDLEPNALDSLRSTDPNVALKSALVLLRFDEIREKYKNTAGLGSWPVNFSDQWSNGPCCTAQPPPGIAIGDQVCTRKADENSSWKYSELHKYKRYCLINAGEGY